MSIACFPSDTRSTLEILRESRLAAVSKRRSTRSSPRSRRVADPPPPKPISRERPAANRANAKKSTGPRTATGKATSSRNALKHGLSAPHTFLESECQTAFHTFKDELEQEFQPRTVLQRLLFNDLI